LAVRAELAQVALVNFAKDLFDHVLQSVGNDGAAKNVELIAQGVGHFHQVAGVGRLEVFVVFFGHQAVAQGN